MSSDAFFDKSFFDSPLEPSIDSLLASGADDGGTYAFSALFERTGAGRGDFTS
jgi:hypothetical protein